MVITMFGNNKKFKTSGVTLLQYEGLNKVQIPKVVYLAPNR